ncbi:MAG: hypothetical protein OSJ70_05310 [Bacilli bacterium]|nr:hypothetical protein [Bacilli bacterium]
MKKFIELGNIFDFYENTIFGYIVYDIESKEVKYYSFFNKEDIYTPGVLHEFDPFNKDPNYYVNDHDFFGRKKRTTISPSLPEELVEYINSAILLHRSFNKNNNLPTEYLDENKKYISIDYNMSFGSFLDRSLELLSSAFYNAGDNSINFHVSKQDWSSLPKEIKDKLKYVARHEVGHMKVTNYTLDESNSKLLVQTGFNHDSMDVKLFKTDDGDAVYVLGEIDYNKDKEIEIGLEEIANDFDCLVASNGDFPVSYTEIGRDLNRLFGGKLLEFRYNATVDDLVAYLREIIPSEDMAYELLDTLTHVIYIDEREKYEQKALSMMKTYEKELAK